MKAFFRKLPNGTLAPSDAEARDLVDKLRVGQDVTCEVKRARNVAFHRKYFSLLNYAYDQLEFRDQRITFDDFRNQVTMLAGYRREVVSIVTGETRWEAQSISFGSMSQEDFEELYDATIEVLLKYVLKHYKRADLDRVMSEIARYA